MKTPEMDLRRWDYNKSEVLVNDSPTLEEDAWQIASPVRIITEIQNLIRLRNQMLEFIEDSADSSREFLEEAESITEKFWLKEAFRGRS